MGRGLISARAALIAGVVLLAGLLAPPAAADHNGIYTGQCGEFGYWAPGTFGQYTNASMAETIVDVSNVPTTHNCTDEHGVVRSIGGTQHSSLHLSNASHCVEVVAYRHTDGNFTMWGYNCRTGTPGATNGATNGPVVAMSLSGYGSSEMTLLAQVGGGGCECQWSTWFKRHDTNQWIYIDSVTWNGGGWSRLRPHAESTGYNFWSTRRTAFRQYKAGNEYIQNVNVTLPCVRSSTDTRQVMQSGNVASVARFGPPGTVSTC